MGNIPWFVRLIAITIGVFFWWITMHFVPTLAHYGFGGFIVAILGIGLSAGLILGIGLGMEAPI